MERSLNTYDEGFRRWKSVRDALALAITSYQNASTEFHRTILLSLRSGSPDYLLEKTMTGIDLELSSLHGEEKRLEKTRTNLSSVRNMSHALVPINRLPPETLLTIFAISSTPYTRYDRTALFRSEQITSPDALAEVSASWRQFALESPSLWSYIKLVISGRRSASLYKRAAAWIVRSAQVPLCVSIYDRDPGDYSMGRVVSPTAIMALTTFLSPFMPRICGLDMELALGSDSAIKSVMEHWIKCCSSTFQKTVQIINAPAAERVEVVLGPGGQISAEEFNRFFYSVSRINLQNCCISKLVPFHIGLVELCLGKTDQLHRLTQEDLTVILTATPMLRILSLADCSVEPTTPPPQPVALNYLESLSLESLRTPPTSVHVLPLIYTGSQPLDMSLTLDDDSLEFSHAICSFFARTRVTRLFAWTGMRDAGSLRALFCPIPHLEVLGIDGSEISDHELHDVLKAVLDGCVQPPWPHLHTLHLRFTCIEMACLQSLVSVHQLRKLHLYYPRIIGEIGGTREEITEEECVELEKRIGMVENFKIHTLEDDYEMDDCEMNSWDFGVLVE